MDHEQTRDRDPKFLKIHRQIWLLERISSFTEFCVISIQIVKYIIENGRVFTLDLSYLDELEEINTKEI